MRQRKLMIVRNSKEGGAPSIEHTFKIDPERQDDVFAFAVSSDGDYPKGLDYAAANNMVWKKLDLILLGERDEQITEVHAVATEQGEWVSLPPETRHIRFSAKGLAENDNEDAELYYRIELTLLTEERKKLLKVRNHAKYRRK